MITLTWTKKRNLGSWLIRWFTEGNASHFSIVFDEKVVFESTVQSGCKLSFYSEFLKTSDIVYQIKLDQGLFEEELVWLECASLDGMPYDYLAVISLGYQLLARKQKLEMSENLTNFDKNRAYMCVEVARALKPIMKVPDSLSTMSPDDLYMHVINNLPK